MLPFWVPTKAAANDWIDAILPF